MGLSLKLLVNKEVCVKYTFAVVQKRVDFDYILHLKNLNFFNQMSSYKFPILILQNS